MSAYCPGLRHQGHGQCIPLSHRNLCPSAHGNKCDRVETLTHVQKGLNSRSSIFIRKCDQIFKKKCSPTPLSVRDIAPPRCKCCDGKSMFVRRLSNEAKQTECSEPGGCSRPPGSLQCVRYTNRTQHRPVESIVYSCSFYERHPHRSPNFPTCSELSKIWKWTS